MQEVGVARETVELRDDQARSIQPAGLDSCSKLWALAGCLPAALNFSEFENWSFAAQVVRHGRPLTIQAKTANALARSADSVVSDKGHAAKCIMSANVGSLK